TSGRVWFTEGGSEPTRDGGSRNHSRVVAYDRAGGTIRVYNLPSDLNSAIGVAWDEGRHRLWVAQTNPGRLTSFDPDAPASRTRTSPGTSRPCRPVTREDREA